MNTSDQMDLRTVTEYSTLQKSSSLFEIAGKL